MSELDKQIDEILIEWETDININQHQSHVQIREQLKEVFAIEMVECPFCHNTFEICASGGEPKEMPI